jgi:putative OPT family oligopeptide transporter
MTLSALLGTALLLLMAGFQGNAGVTATLGVAAVVCCAACAAADCSQDLKTGHILGTPPRWQQLFEIVGAIFPALLIAPVLNLLHHAYGIGTGLKAPQATLFANLAKGVFGQGQLPIQWLVAGLAIGACLVALSAFTRSHGRKTNPENSQTLSPPSQISGQFPFEIHPMAIAVGMYLPFSLSVPIALGGLAHALMVRRAGPSGAESGTLFASGLVAGEALTGVALALLAFFHFSLPEAPWKANTVVTPSLTLAALAWVVYALFAKRMNRK